jgi:hypothetical protein
MADMRLIVDIVDGRCDVLAGPIHAAQCRGG